MQEVELDGIHYRTGKLDAFEQFHIFRKLAPLFSGMGETYAKLPTGASPDGTIPEGFWSALAPVSQALADMTKEDSEYVLRTCLKKCMRRAESGRWTPLTSTDGDLMFDDLDLMSMFNLTVAVIQDNLGAFFGGPSPNGSALGEGQAPLNTLR